MAAGGQVHAPEGDLHAGGGGRRDGEGGVGVVGSGAVGQWHGRTIGQRLWRA